MRRQPLIAWLIAIAMLAVPLIMLATAAPAQTRCGPHTRIVKVLTGKYGEAPKAIGTVDQQRFMEVYVSDAGSWTILLTAANGTSCIIAFGNDWEDMPHQRGTRS